jgi:hypothetical protein
MGSCDCGIGEDSTYHYERIIEIDNKIMNYLEAGY